MKNIQVIDGAMNCVYDIFSCPDEHFTLIFPEPGQDIEFSDDAFARMNGKQMDEVFLPLWKNRVNRSDFNGIHGTLFYEHDEKRAVFPTKKESERVVVPR